ncbi:MAG TPA: type II toxin-antitoxin system VapC family toxin, partial [Gammaproteobacteria bacterium]|nr:type II toxin-antitoxin system VapC family toxin [Gammaproteobacteria bacterium]
MIDASVLIAASVDGGAEGVWAEEVLAEGTLFGPELLMVEASNILRRLERARQITPLEATAAHEDLTRLDVELYPFAPFAERVWSLRRRLTSYDAWYVAVAERLGLPLATLDRRLAGTEGLSCGFLLP